MNFCFICYHIYSTWSNIFIDVKRSYKSILDEKLDECEPNWRNDLAKCKFCDYKDPDINLCLNGNGFVSTDGICDNFVLREKILDAEVIGGLEWEDQ